MEKRRCGWVNLKNERYVRYHDEEWGQPLHDERALFELFLLESFGRRSIRQDLVLRASFSPHLAFRP